MPSYEDQEFKKMAHDFAKATIPEVQSGYDVADGRHTGVITDIGRRVTTGGYRQLFVQYDIVSDGRDKGATPQGVYFLPDDDALKLPKDSKEYARAMSGVSRFNDAYVRLTGKGPFADVGALVRALNDGSLLRALKGRRAILRASHSKNEAHYLYLDVRQGIGPTVAETQPFQPKAAKRPAPKKRGAPARKTAK